MSRRLTRATANELLLLGANDELHDVLALLIALRQAHEDDDEVDRDADNLSSSLAMKKRLMLLAESKLRLALKALGQAI